MKPAVDHKRLGRAVADLTPAQRREQVQELRAHHPDAYAAALRRAVSAPYLASLVQRPFPEQQAFYESPHRDKIAFAGVRSGKTYVAAEEMAKRIVAAMTTPEALASKWSPAGSRPMVGRDKPRELFWVVGPTYQLALVSWTMLRSVLRRIGPAIVDEVDGAIWLDGGVLVARRTGSDERQLQAERVAGVWVDEIASLPEDSWHQIRNRLLDSEGWLLGTGSPRPGTWARDALWDRRDENPERLVTHWTTEDNPHISRAALAEAKATLPPRWYSRDYLADWTTYDGLVWDGYGDGSIVEAPDITGVELSGGMDFGRRRPAAIVVAHFPDRDVVIDELVMSDVLEETFFRAFAALCSERGYLLSTVWVDPAGQARNIQTGLSSVDLLEFILTEAGVLAGAVRWPSGVAERSIINGVEAVAGRICSSSGDRLLLVSDALTAPDRLRSYPRGVPGLHGSILGYCYPESKGKSRTVAADQPVKDGVHDHFADALRMLVVGRYGVGLDATTMALEAAAPPPPSVGSASMVNWYAGNEWDGGM